MASLSVCTLTILIDIIYRISMYNTRNLDVVLILTVTYCLVQFPTSQKKLIVAWIELRKEELITLWNMLQSGNSVNRDAPY